jgi:hypothetical protein
VRPALAESIEELHHEAGEKEFLLSFGVAPLAADALRKARLERAIGVIYRPETERQSHYFRARVSEQFDAVIHIDETRAVEPLERTAGGKKERCRKPIRSWCERRSPSSADGSHISPSSMPCR